MKTKSRISSILNTNTLDQSVTGYPTFHLSKLDIKPDLNLPSPSNPRLGKLVEHYVFELLKASSNYTVLANNLQLLDGDHTLGEIDFILQENTSDELIHLELAFKFYLFDPCFPFNEAENWIGPNKNDSLIEKLDKLNEKQFPLLHHKSAKAALKNLELNNASQELCLLVSLYLPYDYKEEVGESYKKAIKGCYLNFEAFSGLNNADKTYYLPPKKEWGMDPSENDNWTDYPSIESTITASLKEKMSPLCWQKQNGEFSEFFIVWW
jgi:hypothetical protein